MHALNDALRRQIAAQPAVVRAFAEEPLWPQVERLRGAGRLWLVGTGTSSHAAMLGAMLLREAGRDARAVSSATFAQTPLDLRAGDGVVVVSHTGETAFARASRDRAAAAGCAVVPVTGTDAGWPDAIETVPKETAETYTVSYLATLVVLARLAAALGESPAGPDLHEGAAAVEAAVTGPERLSFAAPERLLVVAGAGAAAVTALEGALKAREAARVAAEGFESELLLHGNAVPLDERDRLLVLQPASDPSGLTALLAEAALAEGVPATVLAVGRSGHWLAEQLALTVHLQRLALRLADAGGRDGDVVIEGAWGAERVWAAGAPGTPGTPGTGPVA